ncbi:hypothetical protein FRC11_003597, partial [Ceratobasidium sp. 423]
MADHPAWYPPGQVCSPPELPTYLKNVYDLKPIVGVPSDAEVDAVYTPPALPTHISVELEPISGAPSDEEILKVQDAVRAYQHFSSVPSVFDPHMNMELSQHLFNLQMARYMRLAGERQPSSVSQESATSPTRIIERATIIAEGIPTTTNNPGTGADVTVVDHASQSVPAVDVRELMERSNQLPERFNVLLERSNELAERSSQPT